jgi:hypothetical protein
MLDWVYPLLDRHVLYKGDAYSPIGTAVYGCLSHPRSRRAQGWYEIHDCPWPVANIFTFFLLFNSNGRHISWSRSTPGFFLWGSIITSSRPENSAQHYFPPQYTSFLLSTATPSVPATFQPRYMAVVSEVLSWTSNTNHYCIIALFRHKRITLLQLNLDFRRLFPLRLRYAED